MADDIEEGDDIDQEALFESLMADQKPHPDAPKRPLIPKVVIPRVWPFYNENEDLNSLRSVISRLDSLWFELRSTHIGLEDPEFYGQNTEYHLYEQGYDGAIDVESEHNPDARIAIANVEHMEAQWEELFLHPAWEQPTRDAYIYHKRRTETVQESFVPHPPPNVMAELMKEQFGGNTVDAIQKLMFEKDSRKAHLDALEMLETSRRNMIGIVRPTMALFFASLTAKGGVRKSPTESKEGDPASVLPPELAVLVRQNLADGRLRLTDIPTRRDIDTGKRLVARLREQGRPPKGKVAFREAWRKAALKGSQYKLGIIYDVLLIESLESPASPQP